jgi:hypothetical protein
MQFRTALSVAFVVAIVLLASFSVYESFEIYSISNENSSLGSHVSNLNGQVSNFSRQVSNLSGLVAPLSRGVSMLDDRPYWTLQVALSPHNLTSITFAGVTFVFDFEEQTYGFKAYENATQVKVLCPTEGESDIVPAVCSGLLPQVKVIFEDGYYEYFNRVTIMQQNFTYIELSGHTVELVTTTGPVWDYNMPASYPWFSRHTNPQVAIMLNRNVTDSLTLYVSV